MSRASLGEARESACYKVVLRVSLMSWGHALGDRFRKGFGSGVEEGKELDRSRSSWGLEALGDVSSSDSVAA